MNLLFETQAEIPSWEPNVSGETWSGDEWILCISQLGARTHQVVKTELSQLCQGRPLQNKMCLNCVALATGQDAGLWLKVDITLADGVNTVGHMLCLCILFLFFEVDLEEEQNTVL